MQLAGDEIYPDSNLHTQVWAGRRVVEGFTAPNPGVQKGVRGECWKSLGLCWFLQEFFILEYLKFFQSLNQKEKFQKKNLTNRERIIFLMINELNFCQLLPILLGWAEDWHGKSFVFFVKFTTRHDKLL